MNETSDALANARSRIRAAFLPDGLTRFQTIASELVARYLRECQDHPAPSLRAGDPAPLLEQAYHSLDQSPVAVDDFAACAARLTQLVGQFLAHTQRLHSPNYMGHQVPPPVPLAAVFHGVGAAVNQPMAIREMGPFAVAIERAVVERLGMLIGWQRGSFSGIGTNGGSIANLTAILAARNQQLPGIWEQGWSGLESPPLHHATIIAGTDSHYSVSRAAGILGIGTARVVAAPLDDRRRMDPNRLEDLIRTQQSLGRPAFCIVATAGSTPVGAFDPLEAIAEIAQRHQLWLHVDGCHGASALFSSRHSDKVRGIARADSVAWDAHKLLFVPPLATFVLYRDWRTSYQPFRQDAAYIFHPGASLIADCDPGLRTLECTKHPLAFGLWGMWSMYGDAFFADLVEVIFDLAQRFHQLLATSSDFEPLHVPQCNIVCFRHLPTPLKDADTETQSQFQSQLRRAMVETGDYYLTGAQLDGNTVLRVTLMNPLTGPEQLRGMLDQLRVLGQRILTGKSV